MLSKDERNEMRRRPNKMDEEMSDLYDILTSFYPAQQLTLTLTKEDVINIMNCEENEAERYMKEVQSSLDKIIDWPIRTFDFCDILDVDEMFIQVFLASLKTDGPLPPAKERRSSSIAPDDVPDGPPRTINEIKGNLQRGIMESYETILRRVRAYEIQNPYGEPCYKPAFKNFRIIIRPFEVAQIIGIHVVTARKMFRLIRQAKNMPKQRFLPIRLFSFSHHVDMEDVRKCLAVMYNEKEELID
jgi:hypothetical protein